jgi:hypothetical protein
VTDPHGFARYGRRAYSQAEEDGITFELVRRLWGQGALGTFVEIGVGDGHENNTRMLTTLGWSGVWVGNEPLAPGLPPRTVKFLQRQLEIADVAPVLVHHRCDLFSIDIDGNDYWIAQEAVPLLRPTIVIVEYNASWGHDDHVMPYRPGYIWHTGQDFGASITAWQRLLTEYVLVYTTLAQVNAFFVHRSVAAVAAEPPEPPVLSSAGVLRSDSRGSADVPTVEERTTAGSGDARGRRPPNADPRR